MNTELTDNISRLYESLILGEAYWQREYILNMRKRLYDLRQQKTQWIGKLENDLLFKVDDYLNNAPF